MGSALLNYVQNLWPFSILRVDDLKLSDKLVKRLSLPEQTKQFVFGMSEPENKGIVYILCTQNLSERSARDAECLIREVRPGAVVALAGDCTMSEILEHELVDGMDDLVPTSAFRVLIRCFMDKMNKDSYENLAGNLVLKEIFGVGFCGHFLVARRLAEEVGSSFFVLESPFKKLAAAGVDRSSETSTNKNMFQALVLHPVNLVPQNVGQIVSNSRRFLIANDLQSQMVKLVRPSVALSLRTLSPLGSSIGAESGTDEAIPNYCPPPFAQMVYPLLIDLHDIFFDIPSMGRALAYAQKMFVDIDRGGSVSPEILSEVYTFKIAVEGLRVALNNAGRLPIHKLENPKLAKLNFQDLSVDEKSHCLLVQALRSQAKKSKTVVAIVDANGLAGLRKFWNIPVPEEVGDMVEELIVCHEFASQNTKDGKKRLLYAKPVVAVSAGATAIVGASSLSKVVPVSTVMKVVTLNVPTSLKLFLTHSYKATAVAMSKILGPSKVVAPTFASSGMKASTAFKAATSAEKIRAVTHSVIASAEKTSFSAMRTAFYEIMRKRRIQPIGFMPWATFGFSMVTCGGLLACGDGIECAAESLPVAPSIASLGRGVQNLQLASEAAKQSCTHKIHKAIESLMYRFKKLKIQ